MYNSNPPCLSFVKLLCVAAFIGFAAENCDADLVVNLDTTANTFFFSGSDTGTLVAEGKGNVGFAVWEILTTGVGGEQVDIQSETIWTGTGSVVGSTYMLPREGRIRFQVRFDPGVGDSGTLSFAPTVFSYAGGGEANFESLIGGTLPLVNGSGFAPVTFVSAAVPEPAGLMMLGLACFGLCCTRRRKSAA